MVTVNSIKEVWNSRAEKYSDSHWASWGDGHMIALEVANISKFIKEGDYVLDVGCANGYSTIQYLKKKPKHVIGIDSSEIMIKHAKDIKRKNALKNINFRLGDIRKLAFLDNTYDVTYTTRVLINLPNWKQQKQAIKECIRVTKRRGTIIFSEAFYEPFVLLNKMRKLKKLPPLRMHYFNKYLKKELLENFLKDMGLSFYSIDFSSIYYLGSRFLRELLTDSEKYTHFSNPFNEEFFKIEKIFSGGGFGIQQVYIINK